MIILMVRSGDWSFFEKVPAFFFAPTGTWNTERQWKKGSWRIGTDYGSNVIHLFWKGSGVGKWFSALFPQKVLSFKEKKSDFTDHQGEKTRAGKGRLKPYGSIPHRTWQRGTPRRCWERGKKRNEYVSHCSRYVLVFLSMSWVRIWGKEDNMTL